MKIKQCPETETAVLGTIISIGDYNNLSVQKAMLSLTEGCFYSPPAREIYRMVRKCFDDKKLFDGVSICDLLRFVDLQVYTYFESSLKNHYISESSLEVRVDKLQRFDQLRQQINCLLRGVQEAQEAHDLDEAFALVTKGVKEVESIGLQACADGESYDQITTNYFTGVYDYAIKIPTNIAHFDLATKGGIENGSLVTVCGGSGVGKTFFGTYLMSAITRTITDKQSLFFSLEMQNYHIWERLTEIVGRKKIGDMSEIEIAAAVTTAKQRKITFYGAEYDYIEDIETICRLKAMESPLSVVVVDYLALVKNKNANERHYLQQTDVATRLAKLAGTLNCIVIALSQANRDLGKRDVNDRCPYFTDAADSLGAYRSSTLWLGIDRPELHDKDDSFLRNQFVAKCRKYRNGDPFDIYWKFDGGLFTEINQSLFAQPMSAKSAPNMFGGGYYNK